MTAVAELKEQRAVAHALREPMEVPDGCPWLEEVAGRTASIQGRAPLFFLSLPTAAVTKEPV